MSLPQPATELELLDDVSCIHDNDILPVQPGPSTSSSCIDLTQTVMTGNSVSSDTHSTWHKRKYTHLPPPLKLSGWPTDVPDSSLFATSSGSAYDCPMLHHDSVLSVAPSIVSNAPSPAPFDTSSDIMPRRTKLERLRCTLGKQLAAISRIPRLSSSKRIPRTHAHSGARQSGDMCSVMFSVNSDENTHAVKLTTHMHAPRPQKTKRVYHTGPLPPIPSTPQQSYDEDDAGLIRPRQKMPAGSRFGGADFKLAQRAKREGRVNGMAEPGELMDVVGFMF